MAKWEEVKLKFKDLGDPKYDGKRFRFVSADGVSEFTVSSNELFKWDRDGREIHISPQVLNWDVELVEDDALLTRASEFCRMNGIAATMNSLTGVNAVHKMLVEVWNEAVTKAFEKARDCELAYLPAGGPILSLKKELPR